MNRRGDDREEKQSGQVEEGTTGAGEMGEETETGIKKNKDVKEGGRGEILEVTGDGIWKGVGGTEAAR